MIKIDSPKIKCPRCGKGVYADIFETWSDTQLPTENGFHVFCSEDWDEEPPCELRQDEGEQLNHEVYQWLVWNLPKYPVGREVICL